MTILKSILGSLFRNWMAALLVVLLSHHWITSDQQNQVTVWFNGWVNVALDTLLAAVLPAAIGVYVKLRDRFMTEVARLAPVGANHSDLKAVVANSTFKEIVTNKPSPITIRENVS